MNTKFAKMCYRFVVTCLHAATSSNMYKHIYIYIYIFISFIILKHARVHIQIHIEVYSCCKVVDCPYILILIQL